MPTNNPTPFRLSTPRELRDDAITYERLSEAAERRGDLAAAVFFADAALHYTHPVTYTKERRAITARLRALRAQMRPAAQVLS